MPHSHHSHSGQFCKHAVGTLEQVVQEAISKNFRVFGLTEHVPRYREIDLYPEEEGLSLTALHHQFTSFLEEAHRLKKHYASRISLIVGLETEFITPRDLDELERFLKQHDHDHPHPQQLQQEQQSDGIEYIVGSVHHVNGIPIDFDVTTYRRAVASFSDTNSASDSDKGVHGGVSDPGLDKFLLAYFDAQYELLQRFKPEIIGHIDLCRLYTPDLEFKRFPEVWERIKQNVEYAISYGALFEVNAAAFRKKWDTAYPGRDVAEVKYPSLFFSPHPRTHSRHFVQLILQRGGRFALSDDSHGPHAVGLNYDRAYHYLKSLNVAELWFLEPSEEPNASGRRVRPVKLDNWTNDPFWLSINGGRAITG
ncbi:hypothetical protein D9756_004574 [Leucocoprinus leucothites]|uniref:Histidinol-phosphatase n=1 Tax=Leucocoprinus leucothites TaxID=201217 RepID=A0A8H5G9R1_9AGAR|nr:hypothetical protein D9756_004574 [Leucoagaricus leucothites]